MGKRIKAWLSRLTAEAPAYPGSRLPLYVVGDIHGRPDLLEAVHAAIDADQASEEGEHLEIYLGDYVDRGPRTPEALDLLIAREKRHPCVFLRGNHEEVLLHVLAGDASWSDWRPIGGLPTVIAYGVPRHLLGDGAEPAAVRRSLEELIPPAHVEFLMRTGAYLEEAGYLFVHAGIRPGRPLEAQTPADLFWIRDEFLRSDADHGAIVVHGHTPVQEPDFRANRINIDTGAFATNRLTCLKIDEAGPRILL